LILASLSGLILYAGVGGGLFTLSAAFLEADFASLILITADS
jgi:hypothetical protein